MKIKNIFLVLLSLAASMLLADDDDREDFNDVVEALEGWSFGAQVVPNMDVASGTGDDVDMYLPGTLLLNILGGENAAVFDALRMGVADLDVPALAIFEGREEEILVYPQGQEVLFRNHTPLTLAITLQQWDVVRALVLGGADVNALNGAGDSPLLLAVVVQHADLVRWLIERGGGVHIMTPNREEHTPLAMARFLRARDVEAVLNESMQRVQQIAMDVAVVPDIDRDRGILRFPVFDPMHVGLGAWEASL